MVKGICSATFCFRKNSDSSNFTEELCFFGEISVSYYKIFVSALMVFTIFGCLFVEKIKNKVCVCFFEITYPVLILKILPVTLVRKLVPAFS
jgi:hypothetical protein